MGYAKNALPKGILRQEGKNGNAAHKLISDDDLLQKYQIYMQTLLDEQGLKSEIDAINQNKYYDIITSIKKKFEDEGLYGVTRYSIIYFEGDLDFHYDLDLKSKYQAHFHKTILDSIEKSVRKRIEGVKSYKYELDDFEKKLMENYLNQLLGRKTELIEFPEDSEPAWLKAI